MNSNSISKLIMLLLVLLGALYLALDILSSGGNALGKVYFYLLIGSGLFGLLFPKGAFFYLIILTAYLDYFKRLMILDAGMSYRDLYYVLGVAPATLTGIMASVCYSVLQGRVALAPGQAKWTGIILFGVAGLTIATVIAGASEGRGRAVGDAVNTFIYAALLLVVPVLFPSPQDLERMLRRLVLIYVPAGMYMIYHGLEGITSWELAYVKSGFTIEYRQLGELIFRPFGTMNSAAAASAVFSILVVLAMYGPWGKPDASGKPSGSYGAGIRILATAIFVLGAFYTFTRTGWVSGIIALAAAIIFRFRSLTVLFYTASVSLVLLLIFNAGSMLQNKFLFDATDFLTGGDQTGVRNMALRVTTFTERLQSFQNLLENSKLWTPFGYKVAGYSDTRGAGVVHDAISDALLNFGYIPLGLAIIFTLWSLRKMHSVIAGSESLLEQRLSTVCAGCLIGTLAGCFSVWSQIRIFPVNFYLWLFPSIIYSIAMYRARLEASSQVSSAAQPASTSGAAGYRGWSPPTGAPVRAR